MSLHTLFFALTELDKTYGINIPDVIKKNLLSKEINLFIHEKKTGRYHRKY